VKTTEEQGVGARSLTRNTLGVEGHARALGWGLGRVTSMNYSHRPTETTSWLMHSLSTFGVNTSHKQTRAHKTHHGLDLGEASTFPLIVYCVPLHKPTSKWHFVLGLPNGSPKISKVGTLATLGPHNFMCKPLIELRCEAKL
jgi:hypothetical protein